MSSSLITTVEKVIGKQRLSALVHDSFPAPGFWQRVVRQALHMQDNAGVAQLVERNLAKVEVASSRLVSRSKHWGSKASLFV